jgi:ABC-type branched-subunit amino acid transport system substrate-binding protein
MSIDRRSFLRAFGASALALPFARPSRAAGDLLVFGQSCALGGAAQALGQGMRLGITVAFEEANAAGGVGGRRLQLVSYDDAYEPEKAVANTRRLIDEDGVFALVGEVGTPTSKAAVPVAMEADVPFIAPFTGAQLLREPFERRIVNVRASYFQETEELVERFTRDLGFDRIAVFYQDDSFGRDGLEGVRRALERRGLMIVAEGNYERNTTNVKQGLLEIRKGDPQAVIMIGAYAPCAEFIRLARTIRLAARFASVSFVGTDALAAALGADGAGVIVSQVVPFPQDASVPLVADYHAALARFGNGAKPGFVSLEGYMAGRLVVAALGRIAGEPSRAKLLDAIYDGGPFDLGGVTLTYGPDDNQGMDKVYMTELDGDGGVRPVERLSA